YVEAHGTGTSLGDPIEVEALNQTFQTYTEDTHFCLLGSEKTNIGHLEAAAGVAGVIKVLLMLRHGQIPPSLHITTLNPIINFTDSPFRVVTELCDWHARKPELPLRAGVSSFGFGGVNSHVVLEAHHTPERSTDADTPGVEHSESPGVSQPPVADDASGTLFLLSAKSPKSLKESIKAWRSFVESDAYRHARLEDVCATLITGRGHFPYRYGQYVTSKAELTTLVHQNLPKPSKQAPRPWCVRVGKFSWEHTTRMQRLIAQEPLFQHRLERVQQAVSTLNIPQALHQAAWPEPT
ncbi:MAG: polyketide synthase, partial [Gammaproteobacteria bacterium]|nr:polyketide synthase [Gammaproteobacteria bacterium]